MTFRNDTNLIDIRLLETGKYSDMVIKTSVKEYNLHRAIVCTQSKPMAASFENGFKVCGLTFSVTTSVYFFDLHANTS